MSIQISIPTVLRRFAGDQTSIGLDASNVSEALQSLTSTYPALQKHLFDENGKLRSFVNIYVGSHDVRNLPEKHDTKLEDGAQLTIVPSIAGGSVSDLSPRAGGLRGAEHA